jgi:hypothetical protein
MCPLCDDAEEMDLEHVHNCQEFDRKRGQCQQLGQMVESIKIILDCKKENGRHPSNWRRIKKIQQNEPNWKNKYSIRNHMKT